LLKIHQQNRQAFRINSADLKLHSQIILNLLMVGYKAVRLRIDTTNVLKLVSRSFEDRIGDKVMVFDLYPKYVQ
jgi:hypothetical protein